MERLTNILNQELETFNKFLALLDQQHKLIVSRNLADLNKTNSELDLLCNKANYLERKRIDAVNDISAMTKHKGDDLKMSDILPSLDKLSSQRLLVLRESIQNAHQRIAEKSMRNGRLIEKSRKLIAESMKIITSRPSPIYQKPGPGRAAITEGNLISRSA
ncbi:MAG: flagellar protein FlgN [candidate division Zixibacteria bacterium]|nr:flagellar protein FlgN [candidate division Zixibacteria bacterium]